MHKSLFKDGTYDVKPVSVLFSDTGL
jgi:hypothetical protein